MTEFKLTKRQIRRLSQEAAAIAVVRMQKRAKQYIQPVLDRQGLPGVSAEARAKFRRAFTGEAKS